MVLELKTDFRFSINIPYYTCMLLFTDGQVVKLKQLKNKLEDKMREQEEELDEQAGTIQQLEQVIVFCN